MNNCNDFSMYNHILSAIVVADSSLVMCFVNDECCNVFGYDKHELFNKKVNILMDEKTSNKHDAYYDRFKKTNVPHIIGTRGRNVIGKHKNGNILHLTLSINKINIQNNIYFVASFENLTKNKFFQDELFKRTEFISYISHEIKTPLSFIFGMLECINVQNDISKIKTYASNCLDYSNILINSLNDILLYNRIEYGTINVNNVSFELIEFIDKLIISSRIIIPKIKNITIEYNIDPQIPQNIIADPFLIRQVLSNLINNSIKYTESGKIVLSIQLLDKNTLKFVVTDTGIGMSQLQLQSIFLPYKQLDNMFKNHGIGMGLSICNEIVKKLKGTINVHSKVNKGSTFIVTIPATMD